MAYDSTSNNDYLIALVHNPIPKPVIPVNHLYVQSDFECSYIPSDKPQSHKWLLRKPEIKCTIPICDVLIPLNSILTNLN